MSDFALNVTTQEILREAEEGTLSQCIAIATPSLYHDWIIEKLEMRILDCYEVRRLDAHPDFLVIGRDDKAPVIGEVGKPSYERSTRWLIENIALKPVMAKRRLGVILSADKLLLPAANSLLKLAEEPPEHAVLLFMMEDGSRFLPTLKSRSRFFTINEQVKQEVITMPKGPIDWVDWLAYMRDAPDDYSESKGRKTDFDVLMYELEGWVNYAVSVKDYALASRVERLKRIAEKKNLSVPMICDMIILTLEDEKGTYDYILDDIR